MLSESRQREKIKVIEVKCDLNQGLVIINLHVKFNVHSSNVKQVIVLKVVDSRTDRHDNKI